MRSLKIHVLPRYIIIFTLAFLLLVDNNLVLAEDITQYYFTPPSIDTFKSVYSIKNLSETNDGLLITVINPEMGYQTISLKHPSVNLIKNVLSGSVSIEELTLVSGSNLMFQDTWLKCQDVILTEYLKEPLLMEDFIGGSFFHHDYYIIISTKDSTPILNYSLPSLHSGFKVITDFPVLLPFRHNIPDTNIFWSPNSEFNSKTRNQLLLDNSDYQNIKVSVAFIDDKIFLYNYSTDVVYEYNISTDTTVIWNLEKYLANYIQGYEMELREIKIKETGITGLQTSPIAVGFVDNDAIMIELANSDYTIGDIIGDPYVRYTMKCGKFTREPKYSSISIATIAEYNIALIVLNGVDVCIVPLV